MMDRKVLRQVIKHAAAQFERMDAIVFTTFQFDPSFFERNILPAIFDLEDTGGGTEQRRLLVNARLLDVPVSVFYDIKAQPKRSGLFRYQFFGFHDSQRLLHAKTVLIGGALREGQPAVYLCCTSANVTGSGWSWNCEVVDELWIESSRQEGQRDAVERFLDKLDACSHRLGVAKQSGVHRIRKTLRELSGRWPQRGDFDAEFYVSSASSSGFPEALSGDRKMPWDRMIAFSPYWSGSDELERLLDRFSANEIILVPAVSPRLGAPCMTQECSSVLDERSIPVMRVVQADQFWHAKAYVLLGGGKARIATGSCNFTKSGFGGRTGHIEAMVIRTLSREDAEACLPKLMPTELPKTPLTEEDSEPRPLPFLILVCFDWATERYTITFTPASDHEIDHYLLHLPGVQPRPLMGALDQCPISLEAPVTQSDRRTFRLQYRISAHAETFYGLITEINLDSASGVWFRRLALDEILDSWTRDRGGVFASMASSSVEDADGDLRNVGASASAGTALNFYKTYAAFYSLQRYLAGADSQAVQAFLVSRPDSVLEAARQANAPTTDPSVRFLVLLECRQLFVAHKSRLFDPEVATEVTTWFDGAKKELLAGISEGEGSEKLDWFQKKLEAAW